MNLPVVHVRPNITRTIFTKNRTWVFTIEEYTLSMDADLSPFSFKLTCRASKELCHEVTSYARVAYARVSNTVSNAKVCMKKGIPWHRPSIGLLIDFQLATFVLSSHQVGRLRKANKAGFDLLVAHLRERTLIHHRNRVMHYVGTLLDVPDLIPDAPATIRDPLVVYDDMDDESVAEIGLCARDVERDVCRICQDERVSFVECTKCSEPVCAQCALYIRSQHIDGLYRCPYCRCAHQ